MDALPFQEYHKIQSIYKRDQKTKKFLEGEYSLPEFELLKDIRWEYTEKIDGTNINVTYSLGSTGSIVSINGRTERAQMPMELLQKLQQLFNETTLSKAFPYEMGMPDDTIRLYGEGYGRRIQKGGGDYIPDGVGFILFDVRINYTWLTRESVQDIATKLSIPCAPIIGEGTLQQAVDFCKKGFFSQLRATPPEGLVLRPKHELLDRRGHRIITKIKLKDF
jgi:hypothetical protein